MMVSAEKSDAAFANVARKMSATSPAGAWGAARRRSSLAMSRKSSIFLRGGRDPNIKKDDYEILREASFRSLVTGIDDGTIFGRAYSRRNFQRQDEAFNFSNVSIHQHQNMVTEEMVEDAIRMLEEKDRRSVDSDSSDDSILEEEVERSIRKLLRPALTTFMQEVGLEHLEDVLKSASKIYDIVQYDANQIIYSPANNISTPALYFILEGQVGIRELKMQGSKLKHITAFDRYGQQPVEEEPVPEVEVVNKTNKEQADGEGEPQEEQVRARLKVHSALNTMKINKLVKKVDGGQKTNITDLTLVAFATQSTERDESFKVVQRGQFFGDGPFWSLETKEQQTATANTNARLIRISYPALEMILKKYFEKEEKEKFKFFYEHFKNIDLLRRIEDWSSFIHSFRYLELRGGHVLFNEEAVTKVTPAPHINEHDGIHFKLFKTKRIGPAPDTLFGKDFCYLIKKGIVRLTRGQNHIIDISTGSFIAFSLLLEEQKQPFTVTALTDTVEVYACPVSDVWEKLPASISIDIQNMLRERLNSTITDNITATCRLEDAKEELLETKCEIKASVAELPPRNTHKFLRRVFTPGANDFYLARERAKEKIERRVEEIKALSPQKEKFLSKAKEAIRNKEIIVDTSSRPSTAPPGKIRNRAELSPEKASTKEHELADWVEKKMDQWMATPSSSDLLPTGNFYMRTMQRCSVYKGRPFSATMERHDPLPSCAHLVGFPVGKVIDARPLSRPASAVHLSEGSGSHHNLARPGSAMSMPANAKCRGSFLAINRPKTAGKTRKLIR